MTTTSAYRPDQIVSTLTTSHPRVAGAHLSMTRASTHTRDDMTLLWVTDEVECESGSQHHAARTWGIDDPPHVWDQSGLGDWSVASHVQCGECGSLVFPRAELYGGHLSPAEITAAARELLA